MRNFNFCLCFVIATVVASSVDGQTTSRRQPARQSERVARANWAPVRIDRQAPVASDDDTVVPAKQRRSTPRVATTNSLRVRQVSGQIVIPTPTPEPDTTILEGPIQHVPFDGHQQVPFDGHQHVPLDGHIEYAPMHDVGCDALPGEAGCDCSAGSCDGYGVCNTAGCSTCGELVSPDAWRPCITIGLPQDGWISYEYLGWWQDGLYLPPLVTTSTNRNVSRADAGVLGRPSTQVLFGGGDVLTDAFDGGRLQFGVWLDRCHTWAVAGEFFNLSSETVSINRTSTGDPILARPFFNTQLGREDSELVAFPGVVSGTVTAHARSELYGGGFYFKRLRCCDQGCKKWLFCGCPDHFCSRTERLLGYRYLQLEESVTITEDLSSSDPNNPGSFDIIDHFDVRNQFNGFDMGWNYRVTRGYWTGSCRIKMAIGNSRQTVRIIGQTTVNDPSEPPAQMLPGGLLAQTSNIGIYKQNEFAVVPEINMDLGYQLTDHLRATLGYTFIYWSNVVRPGHIISRDVNPNLLPPPADPLVGAMRPAFAFDTTDYWAQGINFGLEYRW